MHLRINAGKGYFPLNGIAPAVCFLLLRAFMSNHGAGGAGGGLGRGGSEEAESHRTATVESPRRQDGEKE